MACFSGTPAIFRLQLFRNRDLLHEMQRTELLASEAKKSIEVMEKIIRAHDGMETLNEFTERQQLIRASAIQKFSIRHLVAPDPGELPAQEKSPTAKPSNRDELVHECAKKLQAHARGKRVRVKVLTRRKALAKAQHANNRLFAKEYADLSEALANVVILEMRLKDLEVQLPSVVKKLTGGYEMRC